MRGKADIKNVQVQIYLLDESVTTPDEATSIPENTRTIRRELIDPLQGILITKISTRGQPQWAEFLKGTVDGPLDELANASASALLVLYASGRFFALTYGYGRSLMDPSKIERRFGLKVALNAIDEKQLRAVDCRTVEEMTFHTRRQSSRASEVSAFGLDTGRDLLRGVTGIPREGLGASRIAGAESLTISAAIKPGDLPEQCGKLLALYGGDQYKERYGWIDRLQLVRKEAVLERLEAQLSAALQAKETDRMHLAPPETIDWQNVTAFYYWNPEIRGSSAHPDLDADDAIAALEERSRTPITASYLKQHHVWVKYREGDSVPKYTIYSCLVFETEIAGRLYVLSDSDWHEVDLDWAAKVRENLSTIDICDLRLPSSFPGEKEDDYNARASAELNALLMHKCPVYHGPGRDQFEVCDVLTANRQLLHIKRKTRSSTLSHLFMQGKNSAQLLALVPAFRSDVRKAAEKRGIDVEGLFPDAGFSAADFEVVYGVIAKRNDKWPHSLPFFSQLTLVDAATALTGMGYKVSLALVPLIDQEVEQPVA